MFRISLKADKHRNKKTCSAAKKHGIIRPVFKLTLVLVIFIMMLSACDSGQKDEKPEALPAPVSDPNTMFSVDQNINMTTIDQYVGRNDVVYRDVRMLYDPADYGAIGGEADLTKTIKGFKVVPFPYIATLQSLPVAGAYTGDKLFDVVWAEDGTVKSATANYEESMMVVEELFPKDKPIFLMCGGGGYANMMKQFLLCLGWDENLLYNVGANWEYTGENVLELIVYPEQADGNKTYAIWRADYAYIDFDKLNPVEK